MGGALGLWAAKSVNGSHGSVCFVGSSADGLSSVEHSISVGTKSRGTDECVTLHRNNSMRATLLPALHWQRIYGWSLHIRYTNA